MKVFNSRRLYTLLSTLVVAMVAQMTPTVTRITASTWPVEYLSNKSICELFRQDTAFHPAPMTYLLLSNSQPMNILTINPPLRKMICRGIEILNPRAMLFKAETM